MLYSLTLAHSARYSPLDTAIRTQEGDISFRDLQHRVDRLAAMLHTRGFRPGDRLALLLLNCPEFVEITLACARLGVIVVPLNTRYAVPEIDAVLSDCEPKGILRHGALPAPGITLDWDVVIDQTPLEGSDAALPAPFYDPHAVFGLFYTSGTTGKAKGVMLTHLNLLSNAQNCVPYFDYRPGDCHLHAAPMFHLADFPALIMCLASGTSQTMIPRFDLEGFCTAVASHRVTHTVLIPTMINFLSLYPQLSAFDQSSLRYVFYGGSPIAPEVLRRAREKFPTVKFAQGYGMTESSPILTLLTDEEHTPARITSCGRPPFGVELKIMASEDTEAATGEPGEIVARGLNVMKGYWNKPEETAHTLRGGWLHTGDVAQQDEDGFFYIVDRSKDMIVTGGENVYSTEVEAAIYAHPAIKEAAVIGIPDPQWGELVTACVVVKDGASLTPEDLTAFCRTQLATYKVPRRVEFYSGELPKSGTGKILKRTLREPFWKSRQRQVG